MNQEKTATPDQRSTRPVRWGSTLVLLLIVLTLSWYLAGDRLTPYTRQARVQGFVVGVAPRVSGIVTHVWVRNDQQVRAGDRLFQIDDRDYKIALAQARAALADARAKLAGARASIAAAQAKLTAALASEEKARKDARRQQRLHREDPGAISVRRVELAQASWKEAQARVDAARADLARAQESGKSAEEQLRSAHGKVQKAQLDLENTLVVAESRGVISDLQIATGHYARTGQAAMTLVALHDLWIEAQYTENNLGHLARDTPVEFVLDALPGRVFQGKVRSIGIGVSAGRNPPPGTLPAISSSHNWLRPAQRFPVIIHFDPRQPGLDARQLRVGGQAEVIAYTREAALLQIPGRLFIRFMSWLSYAY